MKRNHQNARKTFRSAIAGMFLLSLFATPAIVQAQHFQMTPMNSAPRYSPPPQVPSRPAPALSRPEASESMPAARQSRTTSEESRPTSRMNNTYEPPQNEVPKPSEPTRSAAKAPPVSKVVRSQPSQKARRTREKMYSIRVAPNGTAGNRNAQSARVVETRFPDGTRLVSTGRNQGFVEHPIASRPGYVARTFVAGGRHFVQVYRKSAFHGFVYYSFVPAVSYRPLFYQWAVNPWPAPIYFSWSWNDAPWFGYFGAYFTPAPLYTNSALWLTDYLLAQDLRLAYESQGQSGDLSSSASADDTVPLSPEVKQVIATEVEQELAAEESAVAGGDASQDLLQTPSADTVPAALNPTERVFVVSTSLDILSAGRVCSLTPGDIILRTSDTIAADGTIAVTILSSKAGDCAINSASAIDISTLQEMYNQFRAQIGSGLGFLASNKGKQGLPKGPSAGGSPVTQKWAKADGKAQAEVMQQEDVGYADGGLQNP